MANGAVEVFKYEEPLPCKVQSGQQVTAGTLVELTGGASYEVKTAALGSTKVVGMAMHDADGDDPDRNMVPVAVQGVWRAASSGLISPGHLVSAGAAGSVQRLGAVDEVVTVTNTATSGTYEVTINGQATSPEIAWNASLATIKTALEALSSVGVDDIALAGTPASYTITFRKALASADITITIDDTNATGGTVSLVETTAGAAPSTPTYATTVGQALTANTGIPGTIVEFVLHAA